jgi:hypothetical protein
VEKVNSLSNLWGVGILIFSLPAGGGAEIISFIWGVGLKRRKEAEPFWVGGYGKKNTRKKGMGSPDRIYLYSLTLGGGVVKLNRHYLALA